MRIVSNSDANNDITYQNKFNDVRRPIDVSRRRMLVLRSSATCMCCAGPSRSRDCAAGRNSFMDKLFATSMAEGMKEYEDTIRLVKEDLFSDLRSHLEEASAGLPTNQKASVLEIGIGTGPNLQYYDPQVTKIEGVDPNEYMKPHAEQNLVNLDFSPDDLVWHSGVAEALPQESGSMDAVVCTLVLCSVDDVEKSVQEAFRVLRPGGKLLLVEHVAAARTDGLLGLAQAIFDPLQQLTADGCHLRRNPTEYLESVEFSSKDRWLQFSVPGAGLISPHVAGIFTK